MGPDGAHATRKRRNTISPAIKIGCSVPRSNLAWQSVSETVSEVRHIFQDIFSLS